MVLYRASWYVRGGLQVFSLFLFVGEFSCHTCVGFGRIIRCVDNNFCLVLWSVLFISVSGDVMLGVVGECSKCFEALP